MPDFVIIRKTYPVLSDTGKYQHYSQISKEFQIFSKLRDCKEILSIIEFGHQNISQKGVKIEELYSEELLQHCGRVALLSVFLGMEYRMDIDKLINISMGALLHDFGKCAISDEILNKPDALSNTEYQLIQSHPSIGCRLLKNYGFSEDVLNMVLHHHEKLDGSGYPTGETNLSIETQLITIADMFDAILSKRVYHEAHTFSETVDILQKSQGLNLVALEILKKGTLQELLDHPEKEYRNGRYQL